MVPHLTPGDDDFDNLAFELCIKTYVNEIFVLEKKIF
jgi:hypothetical protein